MAEYEKFDLALSAKLALNYLTRMVDEENDFLPYWLIQITKAPAWARHCRVDDAELVASWYEALWCTREILGTDEGGEVLAGFEKHLLSHWGEDGLRYHAPFPWTHTLHHSFHEDAYILAALNRLIETEGHAQAADLAAGMVGALRGMVYERKTRCFWSGDTPMKEAVYEFPNDVYLKDKGFDFTCVTGRGEESIRNGMMLHALVRHWQITGDEVSLDLATGIANHLIGISRYFNHRGEFFGHVHSAVWVAAGLVLLGRLRGEERYLDFGRNVFDYVESLSSTFGWVPEYAQWHPQSREHCETCCIRDMILCGFELIDAGDEGPYDLINRYIRNQLYEQQFKTGSFIGVDNERTPEEAGMTYRDIDKRAVGGWSGGGEPNSISLSRFRSIAGCCVGTAPQALYQVWSRTVEERNGRVCVNFPIEHTGDTASVRIGHPNEGRMEITAGKPADYRIRVYPFMRDDPALLVNGSEIRPERDGNCLAVDGVKTGDTITLSHSIERIVHRETVRGTDLRVTWMGCDVIEMDPPGEPLRLYQRRLDVPKDFPPPPGISDEVGKIDAKPTEQAG